MSLAHTPPPPGRKRAAGNSCFSHLPQIRMFFTVFPQAARASCKERAVKLLSNKVEMLKISVGRGLKITARPMLTRLLWYM